MAVRIAFAGHTALIGSRDVKRAQHLADRLPAFVGLPAERFVARTNVEAATEAQIIFITVPMTSHVAAIEEIKPFIKGKIIVDVTAPVNPRNQVENLWPPEGSEAAP